MVDDRSTSKGGIRRRLTLAFLLVGLLPAAVAGFLGVRQSLRAAQEARLESEERLISLAAEGVASTLRNGEHILRAAAEEGNLRRELLAGDRRRLEEDVQIIQRRYPDFAAVFVLDTTGVMLANSLDPTVVGRDLRDRDYFQGVLRTGDSYFSPIPFIGVATRVPTLAIATPIRGSKGDLQGVLAGTFTLEYLSRLLAPARGNATGTVSSREFPGDVYLVSPSRMILAHTDPDKRVSTAAATDVGVREVLSGRRGSVRWTDESGEVYLGVFAPLPDIGWGLVYTRPSRPWFLAVPYLFSGILPALLVILVVAGLAGVLLAHHLSRPILDLQQGASRLRAGEFAARLPRIATTSWGIWLRPSIG